jgi:ATP-dependent exoDNAse (exonuclease V) beta subunit
VNSTGPALLPDEEDRRRILEDLESSLFVEAAAGTGKTTGLIQRILSVVRSGLGSLETIVAVTFTEKAAGELKLRVREEIERSRSANPSERELAHLDKALEDLEVSHISTIHGFCADLLRENPIAAGVDPLFTVMPEDEARLLAGSAFEGWFQQTLSDPPEGISRILRRPRGASREIGTRDLLRDAAWSLIEHRDYEASWTKKSLNRKEDIDRAIQMLEEIAAWASQASKPSSYLAQGFHQIGRFLEELQLREAVHRRDYDALEFEIRSMAADRGCGWLYKGYGEDFGLDLPLQTVLTRRDEIKAELDLMIEGWGADLATCLREELRPVVEEYEASKHQEGKLDFLDLLIRVRDLLIEDDGLRARLQDGFTHIFIDEFQDTDPLQAEILLLLAADDPRQRNFREIRPKQGKLFIVGDPKQSIYRFRRADVILYQRIKEQLSQRGADLLQLTTSFRSVPAIQDAVNGAFHLRMRGSEDGSQADYVPLAHDRDALNGQPAVVALPAPKIHGQYGGITKNAVEGSLPDAVAAFIEWLVNDSGWRITEKNDPGDPIPIEHRHICLLTRRLRSGWGDPIRPYVTALEARQIPHVLVGSRSYHDREEVQALRAALTAIEWPDDTVSVYAALRGPFFALRDDALLAYKQARSTLHPLAPLSEEEKEALAPQLQDVADAILVLRRLHVDRNRRPIGETIYDFLSTCRADAAVAFWPAGEQVLANVLRLVERARDFERAGAPSFRSFVDRLEEEADRGEADEAPIVEEGTEGVRIMTVHKAKGLEFPVVILIDPTCNATFTIPSTHVDRSKGLWAERLCGLTPWDVLDHRDQESRWERAEADRLAYVAATRARDLLVVPVLADHDGHDKGWWLDALNPALYPPADRRRDPDLAQGCPTFGLDSLRERTDGTAEQSVAPGFHTAMSGNSVVWWDPNVLDLDREGGVGIRQQLLLEVAEDPRASDHHLRAYEAWREKRARALENGAAPSVRVRTATAAALSAAGSPSAEPSVEVLRVERNGDTAMAGRRYGALVHAILARTDLRADLPALRSLAETEARILGAPSEEIEASIRAIAVTLGHPLMNRVRDAESHGEVRREVPIFHVQDDGELIEGVADLAFREEAQDRTSEWTVVDFKTDREIETGQSVYEEQIRIYARAISAATGEPAHGILLVI